MKETIIERRGIGISYIDEQMTPEEQISAKEWNGLVKKNVQAAIGAVLDGEFVAANYPAGFNYAVKQQYYNADALSALDSRVVVNDDIPALAESFSSLYLDVIRNIAFEFSSEDLAKMNEEETKQRSLVGKIVDCYKESELDDEPKEYPGIMYIMQRIREVTGTDYAHVSVRDYPSLSQLCRNLMEYARLGTNTVNLENAWNTAYDRLNTIIQNMQNPSSDNGGLMVDSKTCVIGWDKLPETEQLLSELKEGNSVSFSLSMDNFNDSSAQLHFDSKVVADIPIGWFLGVSTVNHEHDYDFSQYAQQDSSLDITVIYNGITTLAAVPTPFNNNRGWFAYDILQEAAEKSGKDATGYKLNGSEYNPVNLFGKNGKLRRLKTYVISQPPVISLRFHKFNCEQLEEIFTQKSDVRFNLFGGLIHGEHNNDYTFTDYKYNPDEETIEVNITPAAIGSFGAIGKQTAYVLGGVVESYGEGADKREEAELPAEVTNRHVFIAATEKSGELNLTYEQEHNCKLVYKKCGDGDTYVFDSLWDTDVNRVYSKDYIIVPLRSVYEDKISYGPGENFVNVIGSDKDPIHGANSWKELLKNNGISCDSCATDSYFYDSKDHSARTYFTDYRCNGDVIGGHVIGGFDAQSVAAGMHVYLLPICSLHNVACTDRTGRNGAGFFMLTGRSGQGIRLKNYLKESDIFTE